MPSPITYTSIIGVLFTIRFRKICTMRNCEPRGRTGLDLAVRATDRAPSRTPLSQSASSPLDVKAFNLSTKVHQKGALPTVDLPSSTLQQLVHLSFMLDACREWLHRQEPLFMTCFSRGSSTTAAQRRAFGSASGPGTDTMVKTGAAGSSRGEEAGDLPKLSSSDGWWYAA